MKRCPDCRLELPRADFAATGYCRICHNRRTRESVARNGGARRYHLRRRYGIDLPDIDRMLAEQRGLCAACQRNPATDVDHDHASRTVRALLCSSCNTGLGKFRDDPALLESAITYLESSYGRLVDRGG